MIERFIARVRDEGIPDAEGKLMDCHALDFAANTFDVAGSLFGVMLVPDQAKALREMARVTKPGGRVVIVAYGSPSKFEALHLFLGALASVNPGFEGLPESPPPLEFQVADPAVLRERLVAAGLREVVVDTTHEERIAIRSGRELWDWCLGSNPIPGMLVSDLSEDSEKGDARAAGRQYPQPRERARGRAADGAAQHRGRDEVAQLSPSHVEPDRAHQRERVALADHAGPHAVVEGDLAVADLVLEVDVGGGGAGASAISASARSCVVAKPMARRSISARSTASAPMRRSCELVPLSISSMRNSTGTGPSQRSTISRRRVISA